MTLRPGAASVAELILVALLFAVVLAGLARFARDQSRVAALQRDRLRFEEAVRTAGVILGGDLRLLTPADLAAIAPDSIRIRAFRGGGPICGTGSAQIHVRYRGHRQPDPGKDSVLVVRGEGEATHELTGHGSSLECPGATRLDLDGDPGDGGGYAMIFETGAYVLADGALRYRRGEGGRQPLTEPILGGMLLQPGAAGLSLILAPDADSLPRLSTRPLRVRVSLLHGGLAP